MTDVIETRRDEIPAGSLRKVEFVHGLNARKDLFLENIRANIKNHPVESMRTKRAMLVAGGPSAAKFLSDIKKLKAEGWELWTVNGAHDWLLSHGICPNACVVMDAVGSHAFVQRPQFSCVYYLASQTEQSLFSRLVKGGYKVVMFHAHLDADGDRLIQELDPNPTIFHAGNTVGLNALGILQAKAVRKLNVYGMDSSHHEGRDHAYDNSHQSPVKDVEFFFQGERFLSCGTYAAQAAMFAEYWPLYFNLGMRIEVFGDGLLPAMARHAKEKFFEELKQRGALHMEPQNGEANANA